MAVVFAGSFAYRFLDPVLLNEQHRQPQPEHQGYKPQNQFRAHRYRRCGRAKRGRVGVVVHVAMDERSTSASTGRPSGARVYLFELRRVSCVARVVKPLHAEASKCSKCGAADAVVLRRRATHRPGFRRRKRCRPTTTGLGQHRDKTLVAHGKRFFSTL